MSKLVTLGCFFVAMKAYFQSFSHCPVTLNMLESAAECVFIHIRKQFPTKQVVTLVFCTSHFFISLFVTGFQ